MNALVMTTVLKMSLVIAVAAAVNLPLRRRLSAASRHLVWTLALGSVLLLPVLSIALPSWAIPIHMIATAPMNATIPQVAASDRSPVAAMTSLVVPATKTDSSGAIETTSGLRGASENESKLAARPGGSTWTSLALSIHLVGIALLGLRLAIGRWILGRLVRESTQVTDLSWRSLLRQCESDMGMSRPVRLLRSLNRTMPMAFGLRTPTILIPAIADTWSEDRRRAVLLHELAHIDRRDCLTQLLAEVTCAVYWMHPGVWWVSRSLRIERELACDDRVLSAGTVARDYATHLLELAYSLGGYRAPALVVSMARPRQLEGRMLAVLDAARNRVTPPLRARLVGVVAMAAVVVPLAAAEPVVVSAAPVAVMGTRQVPPPTPPTAPAPARTEPLTPVAPPSDPDEHVNRSLDYEFQGIGSWEMRRSAGDAKTVHLRISDRPNSMHGFSIALDRLAGLSPSLLNGTDGAADFRLVRDAGSIAFEGVFHSGIGAGTFVFAPSSTFGAEMVRRGFPSPSAAQQYQLARGDVGFAYLDELSAQKYERATLDELVRAANHGVDLDFLRGMGSAGYHFGKLNALVRARDHGVTSAYIRGMASEGFTQLAADDLVRLRDHGVNPEYVGTMRALGYKGIPVEQLVRARDHGISADFIRGMAETGYQGIPIEKLISVRDHGVTPDYIKAMRKAGYGALSIDELVNARDHGVSADFARSMARLGPERPSLPELVQARDHGIGPEFAQAWRALGYPPILPDMVRARDHGVSAKYIDSLKELGYEHLSIDDLVRLRDHGVSAAFVRDQNAGSSGRLTVEELVRRRNRGM